MGTHTVRLGVGAAVIAVMTTVSACGGNSKPCAGVAVESGAGVMFLQEGYTDLDGTSYELCARDKCVRGELEREDITRVSLRLPDDVDPETGTVRFRVTPKGSRGPEIDASSAARLTHQSDGCGGGAHSRGLAFAKESGLTTEIPPRVSAAWRHHLRALASPAESP